MEERATTHAALVTEYLTAESVPFELVEHEPTSSAYGDARATHRRPESTVKTVVLKDDTGYVLAAIPASNRLDLHKLREVIGASRKLQLVDEAEMGRVYPRFEVGAVPPFGPEGPRAEVVDRRLLDEDKILCAAGDHKHGVLLDPRDLVRISGAEVADVCED
jgi:Ala-tRNA(Pro) deacylase